MRAEYCLLLATFFAILQFGLEGGIAAGIVAATLYFAFAYAQSQVKQRGAHRDGMCALLICVARACGAPCPPLASALDVFSPPFAVVSLTASQVASIGVADSARSSVVRTVEQQASAAA